MSHWYEQKKRYTTEEDLIKPCLVDTVKLVICEQNEINQIPISNIIVQSHILELSNILATTISKLNVPQ